MSLMYEELARERMRTRIQEAEQARETSRVLALRRAERKVSRAKARLAAVRVRSA